MDVSDLARHGAKDVVIESYPERGWNHRMTDMQATLGLCQLEAARRDPAPSAGALAERYTEAIERDPVPRAAVRARTTRERTWQSYAVPADAGRADRAATS